MSTPRGDIVIVMGDLNAKVGVGNSGVEYIVDRHGVDVRNDSGGRIVDFCSTHHLVIGGTIFQHRTRDKVSWQHPSGRHANQIDHLLPEVPLKTYAIGSLPDGSNAAAEDCSNQAAI